MRVAVINAGSSSLKFKLFDTQREEVLLFQMIEHIGEKGSDIQTHAQALEQLDVDFCALDIIAHRVVHGGEKFQSATLIDDEVIQEIEKLIPLAPLHNGINLQGIKLLQKIAPKVKQVAVFDTAFHTTMPKEAYLYALAKDMYDVHHIRRYGFHGSSHSYVSKEAAKILAKEIEELNVISLHLGNGASACAIEKGKSIDTSMGFTPLEGLVMGTRSGDIDPAIIFYMHRELGMSLDEIDISLNKKSGLLGLCGNSDLREILKTKSKENELAVNVMVRRLQKYIGAYMVLLEKVDAIVFTGGIGENSSYIRDRVLKNQLFKDIKVLVIPTDEEKHIMNESLKIGI